MALDGEKDDGKGGSSTENQDIELELSNETEDQEELYDKDGKPLPWNQSKRFRKLYGEAKEGRKLTSSLKELGLKPADVPRLREALVRLQQYDAAYAQYLEEQKRGHTDDDDDEGAEEVHKRINALKAQLRKLGVRFHEEADQDEEKTKREIAEQRKSEIVGKAQERIVELLEDAGVDLDKMDKEDRKDLLAEFDFKIGQRLARDEEGRAAFIRGSLRPIEKHFKSVLEKANLPVARKKVASAGIGNLPPRMSGSHAGSSTRKVDSGEKPKNVRAASEEVLADLRARNAARRNEEE